MEKRIKIEYSPGSLRERIAGAVEVTKSGDTYLVSARGNINRVTGQTIKQVESIETMNYGVKVDITGAGPIARKLKDYFQTRDLENYVDRLSGIEDVNLERRAA